MAYRAKDRHKTAKFFVDCLGYSIGAEFDLKFDDGSTTECLALAPPEDRHEETVEWNVLLADVPEGEAPSSETNFHSYHAPPEIFVSDGPKGSIVGDWVEERAGIGGIHHIAYEVEDVKGVMESWKELGYAEFYSKEPLVCKETDLVQVFTKPSELTGIIYELITRGKSNKGFCEKNVKALMESTKKEK
jgi:hypothetical protein